MRLAALRLFCVNLLLAFGGICIALGVIEIALHLFMPAPVSFHVRDPYIGKRPMPNGDFFIDGKWGRAHIRTNSLGWNTQEFSPRKPPGIFRIVHIGDSLVESEQVDTDKTFSALIGQMLPETESLNLGVAGRGTYPELLTYRHYARTYDPDLVMLWFSDNDFRDNYLSRHVLSGKDGEEDGTTVQSERLGWLKAFLLEYFRLPKFLYDRFYTNHTFVRLLIRIGLLSMEPQEFSDEIPLVYRTTLLATPEREEALRVTERFLSDLQREVHADGKVLALGLFSSYVETAPEALEELREQFPSLKTETLDIDFTARSLGAIANDLALPFLDLTPVFREAYASGVRMPHIQGEGHHSPEWHTVIAEETVRWLHREHLLPE